MKQKLWLGLAVVTVIFIGYAVWADGTNENASLATAREKRTASLRQVANDRTAAKTACSKKGTPGACRAAQSQYKSDLAVYHSDEAAFRAAKNQQTSHAQTTPSHSMNTSSHYTGSVPAKNSHH